MSCPVFLAYLLPQGSESRAVGPVGKMNKETTRSSEGTIEYNASPYWQDNGWPLNKDGSCRVPYFWRIFFHGARNRGLSDLLER